jgi:small nuclear ribonucleoprotein (snRNP)-like protein
MKSKMIIITVVFFLSILTIPTLYAGEKEFMVHTSADIKTLLEQQVGKRVIVSLNSGVEITGTVTKVGDNVVQLSKPPRKEFYDVIIRLDKINSLMIKVRGQ